MQDDLPPDLRAKLDALIEKQPDLQGLVDRLMAKRAAGSEKERATIEKMLLDLTSPSRAPWIFGIGLVLVLVTVFGYEMWSEHVYATTLAHSTPAVALVKRMDPGDCLSAGKTQNCLKLELEVHRPGEPPYTGSLTYAINMEWMPRVQPGQWLTVAVNPDDPNDILFNEEAMAIAPPTPPQGPPPS